MKDPHALSAAPHSSTPGILGHETGCRTPVGPSLYAEGDGDGHPWLYAPGDLESILDVRGAGAAPFRIVRGHPPPGGASRRRNRSVYFVTEIVAEPGNRFPTDGPSNSREPCD